jgi:hypothetical protein
MPNRDTCREALLKTFFDPEKKKLGVPKDVLDRILDEMTDERSRIYEGGEAPSAKFRENAMRRAQEIRREAQVVAHNQLNAMAARAKVKAHINQPEFKGDALDAFVSLFTGGRAGKAFGGNQSMEAQAKNFGAKLQHEVTFGLERAGVLEWTKGEGNILALAKELHKPGSSGSEMAVKAAGVIKRAQRIALKQLQDAGSTIRELDGYITRQTHDQYKVGGVEFSDWMAEIMPRLDPDRSFGSMTEKARVEMLREIYDDIRRGRYGVDPAENLMDQLVTVHGIEGNRAARTARHRALHFKDAESWLDYNQKFGSMNLLESVLKGLNRSAKDAVMIATLGPNPRDTVVRLWKEHLGQLEMGTPEQQRLAKHLASDERALWQRYDAAFGDLLRPGVSISARVMAVQRRHFSGTLLGRAVLASLVDLPNTISLLSVSTGQGRLGATLKVMGASIRSLSSKADRDWVVENFGIVADDTSALMMESFGVMSGRPGLGTAMMRMAQKLGLGTQPEDLRRVSVGETMMDAVEAAQNIYTPTVHKLSLLPYWVRTMRTAVGDVLSRDLGDVSHLSHAELNPNWKNHLERYGISPELWDVMRRGVEEVEGRGMYMTPEAIRSLPDELVGPGAKLEAELKLIGMIGDFANIASSTPSSGHSAWMGQDDTRGAILRSLWQFKTVMTHTFMIQARLLKSGTNRTGYDPGFAVHSALLLSTAYAAAALKEMVDGKEPPDPREIKAEIFARSGLGGVVGDLIASSQYGGSVMGRSLGPSASMVDMGFQAFQQAKTKGDYDKAMKLLLKQVPGQNNILIGKAFDNVVADNLRDLTDPTGKNRLQEARSEDKRAKERGRIFTGQ